MTIKGEGIAVLRGVTPQEVFDFVLDPAPIHQGRHQHDLMTKLADTDDGMIAREDGRFLGRFKGSVITRYLVPPTYIGRPGGVGLGVEELHDPHPGVATSTAAPSRKGMSICRPL